MKVTTKELPKTQVELTVEISVEETKPYVDKAAARIAKEVNIKGFRKGKVPYDVLKQNVGEATIYEEAFNDIVDETYPKAIEQEKLNIAGKAKIDPEKIAPGNPIIYKIIVPLMPKVTLGEYQSLKAKLGKAKMDDKKFDKTMLDLRKMRGKEKVVNREAKEGDKLLIDFEVKVGGVAIDGGSAQKQPIVIGEQQFIPGFEEELVGMKKDETKDFELTFPEKYKEDLAGKKANFHVKVHDVFEVELPELNDEMAKEMNFESLDIMKEELRKNIMAEMDQKEMEKFERVAIEELIDLSEIEEMPDQLVEEEANKMVRESESEVVQQGLKFDDYLQHIGKTREDLLEEYKKNAAKRLQAALVMRELAIAEKLKVKKEEVDKEIEDSKKMYADVPEAAAQLDSPQYRAHLENILMHKKTFERIISFTKGGAKPAANKDADKEEEKNDKEDK